jgi:Membrane bound O-acyl transferase family
VTICGESVTNNFRDFVKTEVLKACAWYMLCDSCLYAVRISPYKSTSPPDIFSDSLLSQAFFGLLVGIMSYTTLNMQYSLASALVVATGMYTPQDMPPLMGRLRDVSTVRSFWGKFWHQNLRRVSFMTFRRSSLLRQDRNSLSHSTSSQNSSLSDMARYCQNTCSCIWRSWPRLSSTIPGP